MAAPQQPAVAANPPRTTTGSSLLRELAEVIVLAVILYFGISFAVQTVHVEGLSMFATLDDNDYLIADKIVVVVEGREHRKAFDVHCLHRKADAEIQDDRQHDDLRQLAQER